MKKRVLALLLTAIMLLTMIPLSAAASSIPTSIKAPGSLIASETEFETTLFFSVDSELLKFIDDEQTDYDSLGIDSVNHTAQIDWKLNDGAWHYTADWDNLSEDYEYDSGIYASTGYLSGDTTHNVSIFDLRNDIGESTPLQTMLGNAMIKGADESGYDNRLNLANNTFYFRIRLMVSYYSQEDDETKFILSPWSEVLVYGKGGTSLEKPTRLEKPTISNPVVGKNPDGSPKISFTAITPKQVQDADNYIQAKDMSNIEVQNQINVNNTGWIDADAGTWWLASETRSFDVPVTYDNGKEVVIDKSYIQIRTRYVYGGGANVGSLKSEWSNVLSVNTPAYSSASPWAEGELDQAAELGFITDSIKGKMNDPITREEFAEVAVNFYEIVTGKEAEPHPTKTFKDTTNPEVLKALNLGITAGAGDGTIFEPKGKLLRQQMAAMITRTLTACFETVTKEYISQDVKGVVNFKDQAGFLAYGIEPAKFMAKYKITVGDGKGNFGPNDTCTREQAIMFLLRSYLNKDLYLPE